VYERRKIEKPLPAVKHEENQLSKGAFCTLRPLFRNNSQ